MGKQNYGVWFSVGTTGAAAAAVSFTPPTGTTAYITDIGAYDTTSVGTWSLVCGSTTLWIGSGAVSKPFSTPLRGIVSTKVEFSVTGSGTTTAACIAGFYV
ncbi:MAG: hypothetical protein KGJ89_05260 [Patescibacteria group bacterium]|nr:hypothetical protein [Patescibacteria group bacterium]